MGKYAVLGTLILFLIFLGLFWFGVVSGYWTIMIAIIFIIIGFVVGFLLLGSGSENMWVGVPLFVFGIILLVVVWLFPR
ncbi:MAG: hypothetical protein JSV39_01435 [Candidatus Aenigmatarchaeota archaeon]|nr:MAG: hypothetical protein JSV39_01435 [Candidatus Aenigmarchaeota archaeon]